MADHDVATLRWNGIGVQQTVKKRIPLFESCDELVVFKLPAEFQGMKPLRLSRLETSDYMQLLVFNDVDVATYSGWVMLDGNWLSNTFQTKPGDSGGPYVDRNGRLVGIHLGTQGVVAQGYNLTHVLKNIHAVEQPTELPEPVYRIHKQEEAESVTKQDEPIKIDSGNTREITAEDIMREIAELKAKGLLFQPQDSAEIADDITARVIEGTKKSHAALTAEMEKMSQAITTMMQMIECQNKVIEAQNVRIKQLETTSQDTRQVEDQKKKRNKARNERFMKIKVLTEEEYQRMLDEGWSTDEINDAISQLRQRAWQEYEMEEEDYEPEEILDDFLMTYQKARPKNGKLEFTCLDQAIMVVEQARKTFRCPKCKGRFSRGERHNPKTCRGKNAQVGEQEQQPKNLKTGRRGTSQ
nr:MAG: nonstructural polyprotein [Astroviridae sp.]